MELPELHVTIELSYVLQSLKRPTVSGIERVDRIYANHFLNTAFSSSCAIVQSWPRPALLSRSQAQLMLARTGTMSQISPSQDAAFANVLARLLGDQPSEKSAPTLGVRSWRNWLLAHTIRVPTRSITAPPRGSIYLNVSQHHLFSSVLYRWIEKREDLIKIFMLHDLLPLDYPEYWEAGHLQRFDRSVNFIARHATALLTTTESGRNRIAHEMDRRGRGGIPIHVVPLPSPLVATAGPDDQALLERLKSTRYFLMIGTIEPRKNHLLILQLYRSLAKQGIDLPTLVLVGARGWENEQVVDLLERCEILRNKVIEVANLSSRALAVLIGGANALLAPSFDEGYGLPIVEALTLGTPVVASDLATFREASQGRATFIDSMDGPGWTEVLLKLRDKSSPDSLRSFASATNFVAPCWSQHFSSVEQFIKRLLQNGLGA